MMQCTVLLFAHLRDAVGETSMTVELQDGAVVGDLLDQLSAEHPAINELRTHLAVAVNERYAKGSTVLSADDEIALIPPVSGG